MTDELSESSIEKLCEQLLASGIPITQKFVDTTTYESGYRKRPEIVRSGWFEWTVRQQSSKHLVTTLGPFRFRWRAKRVWNEVCRCNPKFDQRDLVE